VSNTITYAGVIHMIIGFTIGRIIGIMLINKLEKRNGK
jgi:membrane protein DedA with SNARE-associated domain